MSELIVANLDTSSLNLLLNLIFFSSLSPFLHIIEMGASATVSMQIAAARPCISSSTRVSTSKMVSNAKASFYGSYHAISSTKHLSLSSPVTRSTGKLITRAMSQDTASSGSYGLPIDLRGITVLCLEISYIWWMGILAGSQEPVGTSMLPIRVKNVIYMVNSPKYNYVCTLYINFFNSFYNNREKGIHSWSSRWQWVWMGYCKGTCSSWCRNSCWNLGSCKSTVDP